MCSRGEGIAKDENQALAWFECAADRGVVASYNAAGLLYRSGVSGMEPDYPKALDYFRRAVEAGWHSIRQIGENRPPQKKGGLGQRRGFAVLCETEKTKAGFLGGGGRTGEMGT